MKRKTISQSIELDSYELDGMDISKISEYLLAKVLEVNTGATLSYHFDYDGNLEFSIKWKREETDAELSKRLEKEAKAKKSRLDEKERLEQLELAEFFRLKAKYGDK